MIGIDTNVVVRFLTLDPPDQAQRARDLIAENDVFVGVTVLLETEWVLRDSYDFPRAEVAQALDRLCALERVTIGDAAAVRRALGWSKAGLDFADALHLAQDRSFDSFATFDKKLVRRAQVVGAVPVRSP